MRILYVVPNVPSRIRSRPFNFIRGLSKHHQVSVLCLVTDDSDRRFASELRQYCESLEVIEVPRWRSFWNCLGGLFSSAALRHVYFYSPELRRRVNEKVSRKEVDLVHAEHLKSVPMVDGAVGKIPTVFDAVDCVSMLEARRRKFAGNPLSRIFSWTEGRRMTWSEARASQLFDTVVITSAVDKKVYPGPRRSTERIRVIPNGVDLEYFGFQRFEPNRNLVVFCAKLDYFPNEDAALYFSQAVWPRLLVRMPGLQLEIVGSRPPRSVRQLDGKNNIRVRGSVPDVRRFLGRAWIALCPLRIQAGIQNKILEAMALGVPVVATRICCPGLAVEPGKHLLVADTPEEFVSAIDLLMHDDGLRSNMARAGRTYVEGCHNWDDPVTELCDTYTTALAAFGTPATIPGPLSFP